MFTINRIVILLSAIVAAYSTASAFWLNWGHQETTPIYPQYYYQQRLLQGPAPYSIPGTEPPASPYSAGPAAPYPAGQQLPAIPIQVPLQAKLTPSATVQNVQLVPCLCPVSQDFAEPEKNPQENVFYNQPNQPSQHKSP